jgi:hypothetical protein
VFHTYPWLRIAMQLGGGGYLLWLAWKLWPSAAPAGQTESAAPLRYSGWQAYRTGFLTKYSEPENRLVFRQCVCHCPAASAAGLADRLRSLTGMGECDDLAHLYFAGIFADADSALVRTFCNTNDAAGSTGDWRIRNKVAVDKSGVVHRWLINLNLNLVQRIQQKKKRVIFR